MARRAYSLATLLAQVNELYPNRSKVSDGWIGDAAHAATVSDHNPDANGVVRAQDFTHDPDDLSGDWLADRLVQSGDKRIKYIIWNKRIWQSGVWKAYSGANDHTKHLHLSVGGDYDNPAKWNIGEEMIDNTNEARLIALEYGLEIAGSDPFLQRAVGQTELAYRTSLAPMAKNTIKVRTEELAACQSQGGQYEKVEVYRKI